ncbi:MAG: hypothetical protein ACJ71K_07550 [Nitrososphaeraceae archaeon]
MIFSTINLSSPSSSSLSNKALAVSVTDVAFGGGGFNLLNNEALQRWYGQCLASLGTTTGSTALSSSIPSTTSPFIVNGGNNGLTSTTSLDNCAQQLQSYVSQLLSSFQQCIKSATTGNGFVGGGAGFSNAIQECALLVLQQQQLQSGLQAQNGNSILNNGFTSTTTNPSSSSSLTPTTPTTSSPFTQFPTTSNGNFGAFQKLIPGLSNNNINNNPSTVATLPSTTSNNPFTQFPTTSNGNFGAFQKLIPGSNNNSNNNLITSSNGVTTIAQP